MFKINYRIVDEIDELRSMDFKFFDTDYQFISGFIEIRFGKHKEGCYYHENPLREGEVGGEIIDYWLDKLLNVVHFLPMTKYAAMKELETVNTWIEFKLAGNNVIVNVARDVEIVNDKSFIVEPFTGFEYVKPVNFSLEFQALKDEVIDKGKRFISEVAELNPEMMKTKMINGLLRKINDIERKEGYTGAAPRRVGD